MALCKHNRLITYYLGVILSNHQYALLSQLSRPISYIFALCVIGFSKLQAKRIGVVSEGWGGDFLSPQPPIFLKTHHESHKKMFKTTRAKPSPFFIFLMVVFSTFHLKQMQNKNQMTYAFVILLYIDGLSRRRCI